LPNKDIKKRHKDTNLTNLTNIKRELEIEVRVVREVRV